MGSLPLLSCLFVHEFLQMDHRFPQEDLDSIYKADITFVHEDPAFYMSCMAYPAGFIVI